MVISDTLPDSPLCRTKSALGKSSSKLLTPDQLSFLLERYKLNSILEDRVSIVGN